MTPKINGLLKTIQNWNTWFEIAIKFGQTETTKGHRQKVSYRAQQSSVNAFIICY